MSQLADAVKLLKKWRGSSKGRWNSPSDDDRSPLETKTDDFLEAYRVSRDG